MVNLQLLLETSSLLVTDLHKGGAKVGDITHCSHSFSFDGGDTNMVVVADSIDYANSKRVKGWE